MNIYIDFDGTLYNNNKFYQNFINIFIKQNIKKEEIEKYINKIYENSKSYDTIAINIIDKYNLNTSILQEVNNLYNEELVFKDTIPFLEKYHKKYNLILLTLGTKEEYQIKKINSTNISEYFKEIIITTKDKSKLNIDYKNGIFIDNNPLELKKFYNSNARKLIRIKRDIDKYSKIDIDINIPEFKDFEELLKNNYIEKLGETKYE